MYLVLSHYLGTLSKLEPTTKSTHIRWVHLGGGKVLSPLHHHCSPKSLLACYEILTCGYVCMCICRNAQLYPLPNMRTMLISNLQFNNYSSRNCVVPLCSTKPRTELT